jgi:polysaccharide pyruvyl transferase WcaK-like protein
MLAAIFGCTLTVYDFWQPTNTTTGFLDALARSQLVVANAEGTLHHKWTGLSTSLEIVRQHNVPLWIINASFQYDDINHPMAQAVASIFNYSSYSSVRDPESMRNLLAIMPAARITSSADLTFLLPSDMTSLADAYLSDQAQLQWNRSGVPKSADSAELHILLSGSSRDQSKYTVFWADLVAIVTSTHPKSVFHVVLTESNIIQPVIHAHPNRTIVHWTEKSTLAEVLWMMRHADVHIGGRFHAMKYIVLAGLPSIAFPGNTHKVRALMDMIGLPMFQF